MNLNYYFQLADRAGIDRNVIKLATDLVNNTVTQYSVDEASEMFRKEMVAIFGSEKPNYYQFQQNKYKFYQIVSIAIDSIITQGLTNQFGNWVEIRNMNWGDSPVFDVQNPDLYTVSAVSDGNGDVRRQRIVNKKITVATAPAEIKIFDELLRLLSGRVNWPQMVVKAAASFDAHVAAKIYDAIYASYSDLTSSYAVTGAYDEAKLVGICGHVEAANSNSNVVIMGTKVALGLVTTAIVSEVAKERRNQNGFYGIFNGWEMREIKQAHKPGSDTFGISDAFLLVVPVPEDKMVKLVLEGDVLVKDTLEMQNADLSVEHTLIKKFGVGVVASSKYGMYKIE
jgi:hypothetical protein